MKLKRITMLVIVLSLASGVLAGMPLHAPNNSTMECCKRAKSNQKSSKAEAARLCCAINCTTSAPTSPGSSFNPAPANFTVTGNVNDQIAALFAAHRSARVVSIAYSREMLPRTFQPTYIQHHSFLI